MIKKSELAHDILGCLDYDLGHGQYFSGVSGKSLDNMTVTFTSDEGICCKLKFQVYITEIDESDYEPPEPPWEGSPEETEKFIGLAKLYFAGDSSVYRADDPSIPAYGLLQELEGKGVCYRVKDSEFRTLGDRLDIDRYLRF